MHVSPVLKCFSIHECCYQLTSLPILLNPEFVSVKLCSYSSLNKTLYAATSDQHAAKVCRREGGSLKRGNQAVSSLPGEEAIQHMRAGGTWESI